jgi:transcriptional regulator GlxA family with amidase domain
MTKHATLALVALMTLSLSPTAARRTHAAEPPLKTRNVAIVLYEGVELLDFAGPSEVFAAAAGIAGTDKTPVFRVYTVAKSKAPLLSQGFVRILPEFSIDDAPRPDIVLFPGGNSAAFAGDPKAMAWAQRAIDGAEVSMSVCTGAFILLKAGVLDGKTATTWYGAIDRLRAAAPKTTVQDGRRFVDQGRVLTTAGVSAGIDGALHLVARLHGRTAADKTARYMEYRWSPEPYLAGSYDVSAK